MVLLKQIDQKIKGWISTSDATKWDTRVALEIAQSEDALIEYGDTKLNGYQTLSQLDLCLEQNFYVMQILV